MHLLVSKVTLQREHGLEAPRVLLNSFTRHVNPGIVNCATRRLSVPFSFLLCRESLVCYCAARNFPQTWSRSYTVDYNSFIKCQLAFTQLSLGPCVVQIWEGGVVGVLGGPMMFRGHKNINRGKQLSSDRYLSSTNTREGFQVAQE